MKCDNCDESGSIECEECNGFGFQDCEECKNLNHSERCKEYEISQDCELCNCFCDGTTETECQYCDGFGES